jgi:hypothetical protein
MPDIFLPRRLTAALATAAAVGALAACDDANPAEVRTSASSFPQIASWSATANPVGTSTVRATLAIKQFLGFRMTSAMTITGTPNTTYQWRIFREGCTSNTAAASNTAATGLLLFETTQSYPDVTTNAAGTGTVSPAIAGSLDSLTAYSVRIRPSQTSATWNGTNPIACGDLKRTAGG